MKDQNVDWSEALDVVEDGIALISPEHTILRANDAFAKIVGLPRGEIKGKKCHEVVHRKPSTLSSCPCPNAMKTKKTVSMECAEPHLGKGSTFLLTASPVLDDKCEVKWAVLKINDITERKRAEEALHHRFEQLQTVYHMTDTVSRAAAVEEIYTEALNSLQHALKADRSAVLLFDPEGVTRFKAWRGLSKGYRKAVEGHSPWSPDEKNPKPILIPNVEEEPSLKASLEVIIGEGIHALGFIPLVYQGRLLGKFMIYLQRTP